MKAATRAISVLRGMWKLVTNRSVTLKGNPGTMNKPVVPSPGTTLPPGNPVVSRTRTTVVPRATTLPPPSLVASIRAAVSSDTL